MNTIKKISLFILMIFLLVLGGCNTEKKTDVLSYYTKSQIDTLLVSIRPYLAKLEGGVNYENRFNPENRSYFDEQQEKYKFSLEKYYIAEDSIHYFLIWKIAPSLAEKKIAIGGRFKKDKTGNIYAFEEIFNTPKMKLDQLQETSTMLFAFMIENGNVDQYLKNPEMIEFPSNTCIYDKENSRWKLIN